nr:hypothetical protein [Clostridia bacterium]
MHKEKAEKISIYIGWAVRRIALVLYDALVVNLSYYLALVIRFYVNNEFRNIAAEIYLPAFLKFAPYFTMLCLVLFTMFGLYTNRWKDAGLNDLNRIFVANVLASAICIGGTLLFVCRMPITYYFIGGVLQFFLVAGSRFAYRLVVMESTRLQMLSHEKVNVMIVGAGETARVLRSQMEGSSANRGRPVCIFVHNDRALGRRMNGLPVLSDLEKLPEDLRKYSIRCVILADTTLPADALREINRVCQEKQVEVQDYSGYLRPDNAGTALRTLLEHTLSPVAIIAGGGKKRYANGEAALADIRHNQSVKQIHADGGVVVLELDEVTIVLNDMQQDWVKDAERENGEEISFF